MLGSTQRDLAWRLLELGLAGEFCDLTVLCSHCDGQEEVRVSKILLAAVCPGLQGRLSRSSVIELPVSAAALKATIIVACGRTLDEFNVKTDASELSIAAAAALNLQLNQQGHEPLQTGGRLRHQEGRCLEAPATFKPADVCLGICLSAATVAAWMPSSTCTMKSFFMDDAMIGRNPSVYADLDFWRLFRTDYWGLEMFAGTWTHKSFRPLTVLTFRWNYLMHGFDSAGFHITNLCIHYLCSVLLGVLGAHAGLTGTWASCLALLFMAHPVHTESVLYIVGRADLLCFFFILVATLVHGACSQTVTGVKESLIVIFGGFLSCMLLLAAGLCKETGFCFFGLLVCWDILLLLAPARNMLQLRWRVVLVLAFGAVCCSIRIWFTGTTIERMDLHSNPVAAEKEWKVRVLSYALVHGIYVKLLAWPAFLCYDYSFDAVPVVRNIWDVRLLLPLAGYTSLAQMLTASISTFRLSISKQAGTQVPMLGLAMLLLGFLPMSNILFPVGTMVAERLLYIPSAGFLVAIVGLAQLRAPAVWRVPVFVIGIIYAHVTAQRVLEWATPETITLADAARQRRSTRVQYNLGSYHLSNERYDEALNAFQHVMQVDPTGRDCMPLYRAGQILFYKGDHMAAEQLLAKAIQGQFSPLIVNEEEIFHDYALALWFAQKPHDALTNFEKSLGINDTFTKGLNNLGCALGLGALLGKLPSPAMQYGIEQLQQAVHLSPSSILYWRNLVALLRFDGQQTAAESAWEYVLFLDPAAARSPPEDCSWEFTFR